MFTNSTVIAGSFSPKPSKILMNSGTILYMMKTKMPTATMMTTTG